MPKQPVINRAHVGLSRSAVVEAALALIDEAGLEDFSVRALAKRLGVYPTALHWHAGSRSELLGLVVTHVAASVPVPDDREWEPFVRGLAEAFRDTLHAHPSVAPAFTTLLLSATPELPAVDALLDRLERAGLRDQALVDAYNAVTGAVVGFIGVELATVPVDDRGRWREQFRDTLDRVDAERFPALARNLPMLRNRAFMTRWDGGREAPMSSAWRALLDMVVEGLRVRLR